MESLMHTVEHLKIKRINRKAPGVYWSPYWVPNGNTGLRLTLPKRTKRRMTMAVPKTYTWVLMPTEGLHCLSSIESYQTVTNLWEMTELTTFHDAELAQ